MIGQQRMTGQRMTGQRMTGQQDDRPASAHKKAQPIGLGNLGRI
jgi:hypothetical protein